MMYLEDGYYDDLDFKSVQENGFDSEKKAMRNKGFRRWQRILAVCLVLMLTVGFKIPSAAEVDLEEPDVLIEREGDNDDSSAEENTNQIEIIKTLKQEMNIGGSSLSNLQYVFQFTDLKTILNTAVSGDDIDIVVMDNVDFPTGTTESLTIPADVKVHIYSSGTTPCVITQVSGVRQFLVEGDLTLTNITIDGGGILVSSNGALTMFDGTTICNNIITVADSTGGGAGVAVEIMATFTMNGGKICNNTLVTSPYGGGGVLVKNRGNFIFNGGEITENWAERGSAIYSNGYSTMNGGQVYSNDSAFGTIMVALNTFTMNGGFIRDNISTGNGGGVSVFGGEFLMQGGEISGNQADTGGGLLIGGSGEATMKNGVIKNNIANLSGGGIFINQKFKMEGGTVTGNRVEANGRGGGVFLESSYSVFEMTGGSINGNLSDVLRMGCDLYLTSSTPRGLTMDKGVITGYMSGVATVEAPSAKFLNWTSENSSGVFTDETNYLTNYTVAVGSNIISFEVDTTQPVVPPNPIIPPSSGSSGGGSGYYTSKRYINVYNRHDILIDRIDITNRGPKNGVMELNTKIESDSYIIYFEFDLLSEFLNKDKQAYFNIETPNMSYQLPFNEVENIIGLTKYIKDNKQNTQDLVLKWTIKELIDTDLASVKQAYFNTFPTGKSVSRYYYTSFDLCDKRRTIFDVNANQFRKRISFNTDISESGNAVLGYNEETGFCFTPTRLQTTESKIMTIHHDIFVVANNDVRFLDIAGGKWYTDVVTNAANRYLVVGVGNGLFEPERSVTRAEFVQMLVNSMQLSKTKIDTSRYVDVNAGDWYYNSIMKARTVGLLNKFGENTFKPNKPITREEMAVLLTAVLKREGITMASVIDLETVIDDYKDIDINNIKDIEFVYSTNIMVGVEEGKFDPKGLTTRAQAATVQINMLKYLGLID